MRFYCLPFFISIPNFSVSLGSSLSLPLSAPHPQPPQPGARSAKVDEPRAIFEIRLETPRPVHCACPVVVSAYVCVRASCACGRPVREQQQPAAAMSCNQQARCHAQEARPRTREQRPSVGREGGAGSAEEGTGRETGHETQDTRHRTRTGHVRHNAAAQAHEKFEGQP